MRIPPPYITAVICSMVSPFFALSVPELRRCTAERVQLEVRVSFCRGMRAKDGRQRVRYGVRRLVAALARASERKRRQVAALVRVSERKRRQVAALQKSWFVCS